jgi:hypothetical protein
MNFDTLVWFYQFKFVRYIVADKWFLIADYNCNRVNFGCHISPEGYQVLQVEDFTNRF